MTIFDVKKRHENHLFKIKGVIGVGVGKEEILVYVQKDVRSRLDLIPTKLESYSTKVIATKGFVAYQGNTAKMRPISGANSIGQPYWGTGTLATVVRDRVTGKQVLLSNNHVFAKSNNNEFQWAKENDPIIQPGYSDGGQEGDPPYLDTVARLKRWVPLQLAHWINDHFEGPNNYVDCAIAEPINDQLISTHIENIGAVNQIVSSSVGMSVRKCGRTTGLTYGTIEDIAFTGIINYGVAWVKFTNQIVVTINVNDPVFSSPGDSGSLVVDASNRAIGLLFAGDDEKYSICNPIQQVLNALNIELSTLSPVQQTIQQVHPIAHIEVNTTPVAGDIFIDDMYAGNGYVQYVLSSDQQHTLTFGDVKGYKTPEPWVFTPIDNTTYSVTYKRQSAVGPILLLGLSITGAVATYFIIKRVL